MNRGEGIKKESLVGKRGEESTRGVDGALTGGWEGRQIRSKGLDNSEDRYKEGDVRR